MAKKGRPNVIIDLTVVDKLARVGLTTQMIADYLEIHLRTCERNEDFCRVYKKSFTQLGAKVRTTLIAKMEVDTTANIYLDKVINKTKEANHDENYKLKVREFEHRVKMDKEDQKLVVDKLKLKLMINPKYQPNELELKMLYTDDILELEKLAMGV